MGGRIEGTHVSHEMLRVLFRDVDQTVVVCQADGLITFVAGASAQLLGCDASEVEGRNILDFLRPEVHAQVIDSMARWADRAGSPAGEVLDLSIPDGTWVPVRYDVVTGPEVAEMGTFVLTLRAADDDTPGRRLLLERLLNEDRLVRLASAFLHHSIEDFERCVDEALIELAALDWVTRVSVWTSDRTAGSSPELLHARRRAQWAARTGAPVTELPQRTRMDESPFLRQLRDLEEVHIRSVAQLPDDWGDVKEWLEGANVRSLLAVPMVVGSEFAGFIMAEITLDEIAFDVAMISTLRSAAAIFASAFRRNQAEHELAVRARTDELTGLANRWAFQERLKETVTPAMAFATGANVLAPPVTSTAERVVVGSLNLDRFHVVNPALGREAGDRLLVDVARRLSRAAGDDVIVARNQSDEFSLLFTDVDGIPGATRRAQDLLESLRAPFPVGGDLVTLTGSIGLAPIAAIDEHADAETVASELGRRAELAMRQARQLGGDRIEADDRTIRSRVAERVRRESELRSGIASGELTVHYQPELDLVSRTMIGAEALARWNHPVHGMLPAVDFIPIAEESGFIADLGEQVLRSACLMLAGVDLGPPERTFELKVNVSTRQLDATLPRIVSEVLDDTGLSPSRLCFELTESALLSDPEGAVVVLRKLRDLGVGLAIDDFGTGYSSMLYLKRLPVTLLKIDQTFVAGLPHEVHDRAIVRATVQLATSLAIDVTAEGVETEEQVEALLDLGCTRAQGFLLGRPAPADALFPSLHE